ILIRSGISPLDNFNAAYMINNNSIGGNVGNLIYAYTVYRTLMTEDTNIVPDYYSRNPKNADEINEKYDAYHPFSGCISYKFHTCFKRLHKINKKIKDTSCSGWSRVKSPI